MRATQISLPFEAEEETEKEELMKLSEPPQQLLITDESFFVLLPS